ncbi:unnamed protein product, partial [Brassica oleracea var. botrytis]
MEELREVTLQYISCPDPVESAARKQRVLLSELDGTVDETATRIIQASTSAAMIQQERLLEPTVQLSPPRETETALSGTTANPARKRGRPRRTTDRRTTIKLSPKTFMGTGSRKRNLARQQASPGLTSRAGTSQNVPTTTTAMPQIV